MIVLADLPEAASSGRTRNATVRDLGDGILA
jgi:hypothetical protein